nr:MAG TPA: chromosome partition protein [Caudoviricetes sp.]
MKRIVIKKLTLVNFKGIRSLTLDFNEGVTTISGRNGLGKTTIFDAFTWLLFGKDSKERKQFGIKTYGKDGKTIPSIPHEVSGVLQVDGEDTTLTRRFTEKWQKKHGTTTRLMTGHEEERLYNDVPMSVKDWAEKIESICPEQVFKFITNPLYFSSQKADVQRAMLFRMAGEVTDEEVAKDYKNFQDLLAQMTGKTMEEYKREIDAKKKRIKADVEAIPERMDECQRQITAMECDKDGKPINFNVLRAELEQKQAELAKVEDQIADITKAYNDKMGARLEKSRELGDIKNQIVKREAEIKDEAYKGYREELNKQQELHYEVDTLKGEITRAEKEITKRQAELDKYAKVREEMIAEWQEINKSQLTFDDKDFVCPTCHRHFDIDDIEAKQREMAEHFNEEKKQKLEDNTARGKANSERMKAIEAEIKTLQNCIANNEVAIKEYASNPLFNKELAAPDATPLMVSDNELAELKDKANALQSEIEAEAKDDMPDTGKIASVKRGMLVDIDSIKAELGKEEYVKAAKDRLAELEKLLRIQSEELAQLEATEDTMMEFAKERVKLVENKINSMFTMVKFKMFDTQINGGVVETCEAVVDGVPYSTQNNAMVINIGIDIINAICRSENISAPIFVDNAESLNSILPTPSQLIRLVVTEDEQLKFS